MSLSSSSSSSLEPESDPLPLSSSASLPDAASPSCAFFHSSWLSAQSTATTRPLSPPPPPLALFSAFFFSRTSFFLPSLPPSVATRSAAMPAYTRVPLTAASAFSACPRETK